MKNQKQTGSLKPTVLTYQFYFAQVQKRQPHYLHQTYMSASYLKHKFIRQMKHTADLTNQ